MTQEEINVLYNLTILIHEHEWFGERKRPSVPRWGRHKAEVGPRNREEVQEWVAKKLAETLKIYTTPCGMCWGILTTKEKFDEYWNEHSKIKEE